MKVFRKRDQEDLLCWGERLSICEVHNYGKDGEISSFGAPRGSKTVCFCKFFPFASPKNSHEICLHISLSCKNSLHKCSRRFFLFQKSYSGFLHLGIKTARFTCCFNPLITGNRGPKLPKTDESSKAEAQHLASMHESSSMSATSGPNHFVKTLTLGFHLKPPGSSMIYTPEN